jgi:hypothetical protein
VQRVDNRTFLHLQMTGCRYCHELPYWLSLYSTSRYFYVRYYDIGPAGTSSPKVRKPGHAFTALLETAASSPDYLPLLWSCAQRTVNFQRNKIWTDLPYVRTQLGRPRCDGETSSNAYILRFSAGRRHYTGSRRIVVGCVNAGWIPLAQDGIQRRGVVTTIVCSSIP